MTWCKTHKTRSVLVGLVILGMAASAAWAAYTRGTTGNETRNVLEALEYLIASNDASGGGSYIRQDSTATIAKESGGNLAAIASALGSGVTQVEVPVNQGAAGSTVIVAAEGGQTVCIHEIILSVDAADDVVIEDSDGTDWAVFHVAATGQVRITMEKAQVIRRMLTAGKGLTITTAAGKAAGYVIYSKAAS